jgi:hypothetical protein
VADRTAVWKAVANFAQPIREARKLKRELERLDNQHSDNTETTKEHSEAVSENSGQMTKLASSVGKVSAEMRKNSHETAVAKDNMADLGDETDRTRRIIDEEGSSLRRAGNDGNFFARTLNKVSDGFTAARMDGRNFGAMLKLLKLPAIVLAFNLLTGAISAVGGAVVALLPNIIQLGGLLGAMPGTIFAIGAAAGTMVAGLSGVGEAMKQMTAQEQAVADEARDTGEALTATETAAQNLEDAMKDLSPAAREFARYLFSLKDRLIEIRQTAQTGLLPGLQEAMQNLMTLFPVFNKGIGQMAKVLGDAAVAGSEMVSSGVWSRDFSRLFRQSAANISIASDGLWGFFDAIRNVTMAAQPMVRWLAEGFRSFGQWAAAASAAGRASGGMRDFFRESMQSAEQLWQILKNLWGALMNVLEAGEKTGETLWQSIEDVTAAWERWTGKVKNQNAIKDWFEAAIPVMHEFALLIGAIFKTFLGTAGEAQSQLGGLFEQMRTQLLPALKSLSDSVSQAFGPAIIELISEVARAFAVLGGQSGTIVAFLNVITKVLETFNDLIERFPVLNHLLTVFFTIAGTLQGLSFVWSVLAAGAAGFVGLIRPIINATRVLAQFIALASARGLPIAIATLTGGGGLGGLLSLLNPVTAGLTALAAAAAIAYVGFKDSAKAVEEYVAQLRDGTTAQREFIKSAAEGNENTWGDALRQSFDQNLTGGALNIFGKTTEEEANAAIIAFKEVERQLGHMSQAFDTGSRSATAYIGSMEQIVEEHGAGAIGAEEYTQILRSQLIPGFKSGTVSQQAWNDAIQLGNTLGVDAKQVLAEYNAEQRRIVSENVISNVFTKNRSAVEKFAAATDTTFQQLVKDGAAAYQQSRADGNAWVKDQLSALRDIEQGYRETFDFVGQSLDEFAGDAKVNSGEILETFRDQNEALADYQKNWNKVSERAGGDADSLLEHIAQMGQDGEALLESLANANDREFKKILAEWKKGEEGSKNLAQDVTTQLVGAIDKLREALKKLPERIAMHLDLDARAAREKAQSFLDYLKERQLFFADIGGTSTGGGGASGAPGGPGRRGGGGRGGGRGTGHTGGYVGRQGIGTGNRTSTTQVRKPGEVDARLLEGEYVVNPRAAARNFGLLERINATGKYIHAKTDYHLGGTVSGRDQIEATTGAASGTRDLLRGSKVYGRLGIPKFQSPMLAGDGPNGYTASMWALNQFVYNRGHNLSGGPVPGHLYTEGDGYSQHAYGNARDYFGSASAMMAMFTDVVRNAIAGPLRNILYHAIHAGRQYVKGMSGTGPYSGTSDPHYGHVHLAGYPPQSGVPGRRLGGPGPGMAEAGEFTLNRHAVDFMGGMKQVAAINASATRSGLRPSGYKPKIIQRMSNPQLGIPRMSPIGGFPGPVRQDIENLGGVRSGNQIRLDVEIDGRTLVKTIETHERNVKLRVGGRSRRGLNSGGRR